MSGLYLMPQVTAREQASEQARVAAEVTALMRSGNQLLTESGLGRIFPRVHWDVVDRPDGRDPSWVVVHDVADPTYLLLVRRARRPISGPGGFQQWRHTVRVALPSRLPWRRWRAIGQNITRAEHLAAYLARLEAAHALA